MNQNEPIENLIDAWLIEFFQRNMTELATVKTALLRDPNDWREWALPGLGIGSRVVKRTASSHGGGKINLEKQIPYALTFVANDEQDAAIYQVRRLMYCAERLLIDHGTPDIRSDYESVQDMRFYEVPGEATGDGLSRVRVKRDMSSWFGLGDLALTFHTG